MLWVYFEEFYWAWSYEEQGKIGVFSFKLQLWLLLMNFSFQYSVDCYKQFFSGYGISLPSINPTV